MHLRLPYERWFGGLKSGDVDLSLSALTDDVIIEPPEGDPLYGCDQVRELLLQFHAAFTEEVTWTLAVEAFGGDVAEVTVHETAKISPRSEGSTLEVRGRHRGWLRHENGEWRIARDVSIMEQAEPPSA
jgi:ketosteroid isomerase-like protein